MENDVTIQVRMPKKVRDQFKKEAKKRGLSLSAWLRMIAHEELERREAK